MASITETLGRDLAHTGDLRRTATGDLDTIEGLANVRLAILHRLITEPGALIHRPNYGVGLKRFQNAPMTLSNQRDIALRIQEQLPQDPRVEEVLGIRINRNDSDPSVMEIVVRASIVGYGESELKFMPFSEGV